MREILQVRFGEIFLKGSNRPYFMRMLVERIRNAVKELNGHVWLSDSRVYVSDMTDMDEAIRRADRKTIGHFFDVLFSRRYDEEDMKRIIETINKF